jgi:hypothetical protein
MKYLNPWFVVMFVAILVGTELIWPQSWAVMPVSLLIWMEYLICLSGIVAIFSSTPANTFATAMRWLRFAFLIRPGAFALWQRMLIAVLMSVAGWRMTAAMSVVTMVCCVLAARLHPEPVTS